MLRYTTLGAKLILGIALALAAAAAYLPFLEAFALTPAIAFIHRFSITLNIGTDTKTLQPIVFVIPILLLKGLWDYHKKHGLASLLKSRVLLIIGLMVLADFISLLTSTSRSNSLGVFIVHATNIAIFSTSCLWLSLTAELVKKPAFQKVGIALIKTFAIALVGFTVANTVTSVTQFVNCSFSGRGCVVWKQIDTAFPNKLLVVGHQKFSYKPLIIRAPGFFGDVNFNGMFSIFVVICSSVFWVWIELIKRPKGYNPSREQQWLLVPIIAGLISFGLTLSRSALLGAGILGIVLFVILLYPQLRRQGIPASLKKKIAIFSMSIIGLLALVIAIGYRIPLSNNGRTSTLSTQLVTYVVEMFSPSEDSAQGHASLFVDAIKIGNQSPIFGMGMGTFGIQFEKIIAPGTGTNASPHSTYGLLYAEQGVVGLALYGFVIVLLWQSAIKNSKSLVYSTQKSMDDNKKLTREYFLQNCALFLLILIAFGIPFFSIATITYYGFFLPMTWWWGNGNLISVKVYG